MNSKKSILIITRNLPPLIGGMERLNWYIADELSKDHQVTILSHTQAKVIAPPNTIFYSVPLNPLPLFLICAFFRTFWLCLIRRPDILFAGSGLTAPIAVFWAKIFRKKSMVYIHGLDIGTNHPLYNFLWVPFIRSANVVIANSSPTYDLCVQKGVSKAKLQIICPGVSYPPTPPNQELIQKIKDQYHLQGKKVLISIGRLTQRKGLNEFLDLSFAQIVKAAPNTILIVIGDTPNQSLNKNLQSKELILSTVRKHGIEDHVVFIGNISDYELLSNFYDVADIHVFPVKYIPDDPEGFGMVAIEAAAHGKPTIAFATGGIVDAVQDGKTGFLVEKQNYEALTEVAIQVLQEKVLIDRQSCESYAEQFAWYNLKDKFERIIMNL